LKTKLIKLVNIFNLFEYVFEKPEKDLNKRKLVLYI